MAPSLSTLRTNGIEIEEDPTRITPLPPYAEDLRRLLLNFEEIVPLSRKPELEQLYGKDQHLLNENFRLNEETIYIDSSHAVYLARWQAAQELRNKAMYLPNRKREDTWNLLVAGFVFQDINVQASDHGILLRDLLSWGSNELFTNTVAIRGRFLDNKDYPPKPDFWFGLGLYNDRQLSRLKGLEITDRGIDYFTQEKLEDISKNHPAGFIYQPVKSRIDAAFPWMVVELKNESEDEKECLRQAANASHASLLLCERLAAPANIDPSPIVAFTSVGPRAKVFIAYKSEEEEEEDEEQIYRIACIWSGNIENILHAVQLRRIVDQLMYWALRIFKPWVTECLKHWYREETEGESEEETEEESEEETEEESEEGAEGGTDSSTRKDKQTQTLGDGRDFFISRNHNDSSEDHSEEDCASGSGTVDSDQSRSPSMPVRGRHQSSDSQPGTRLQAENQSNPKIVRRSNSSGPSGVGSEPIHASSTSDAEEDSAQSTSELESRLQNVRIRIRNACIRSLILTNHAQLLEQRIRLEQIRSCGF